MKMSNDVSKKRLLILFVLPPLLLVNIAVLFYISIWMPVLNDVLVFDIAQEISIGQDIILGKKYWLESAVTSTRSTALLSIFISLLLYYLNRFILSAAGISGTWDNASVALFMLGVVSINFSGLYATVLMLIRSFHIWWPIY